VIDEAGQRYRARKLDPILKAKKLVLAGDHCQLPPPSSSREGSRNGLGDTACLKKSWPCIRRGRRAAREQYRMNEMIMIILREYFMGAS